MRAFGNAPEALLITVGGRNFELGEKLSPEVAKTIRPIVYRVIDLVS
jgi:hypothetical protein